MSLRSKLSKKAKKKAKKTARPASASPEASASLDAAPSKPPKALKRAVKKAVRKAAKKGKKGSKTTARDFAQGVVSSMQTKMGKLKDSDTEVGLLSDSDILSEVTEWISSGFDSLDQVLGGGWPIGRCSEVFGAEGAGKSALTHMAIRECQRAGGVVLYIDFEHSLDPTKLEQLGIDPDTLIYCAPDTLEQAWDLIYDMLKKLKEENPNAPTLIIWDSIAASVPAKLLEADAGDHHVALIARSMSQNAGKVMHKIAKVRAHLMWVNQERHKIGGFGFGEQYQTTGGKAVPYASSLRVQLRRRMTIKQGDNAVGYLIQVRTVKNRCYPPHRKVTWVLDFRYGPSSELTYFFHLKDAKVLKTAGAAGVTVPWLEPNAGSKQKHGTLTQHAWVARMAADAEFAEKVREVYAEKVLPALRAGTREAMDDTDEGETED